MPTLKAICWLSQMEPKTILFTPAIIRVANCIPITTDSRSSGPSITTMNTTKDLIVCGKILFLPFLVSLVVGISCNPFGCAEHEPRYFAEIAEKTTEKTRVLEVSFNLRLSECVNGFESDDFAWQAVRVDSPTINGKKLHEHSDSNRTEYVIELENEPLEYLFSFSLNGKTYESEPTGSVAWNNKIRISMKPRIGERNRSNANIRANHHLRLSDSQSEQNSMLEWLEEG